MEITENPYHIRIAKYYRHHLEVGYDFRGHRHGTVEMNIILKGEMEITCGGGVVRAGREDILFIPSGAFHRNRVLGTESAEMLEVRFSPEGDVWQGEFSVYHLAEELRKLIEIFCFDMDANATVINGDCHKITESAEMLFRVFLQYATQEPKGLYLIDEEGVLLYQRAVQFMTQHIFEKLTLDRIARECGVCRTTIKNVFSRYTGQGCITYFEEMKLNRAKDVLLTGAPCAEVAAELGFSSQAHFSKRFKKVFGVLPSHVKRRNMPAKQGEGL